MPNAGTTGLNGTGLRSKATSWSPLTVPSSCALRSTVAEVEELGAVIEPFSSSTSEAMLRLPSK